MRFLLKATYNWHMKYYLIDLSKKGYNIIQQEDKYYIDVDNIDVLLGISEILDKEIIIFRDEDNNNEWCIEIYNGWRE